MSHVAALVPPVATPTLLRVLPYADGTSATHSHLVRIGGYFGFAAIAMAGLYVPLWWPNAFLGFNSNVDHDYEQACHRIVPVLQALAAGARLALVVAGYLREGGRRCRAGWLLALAINIIALGTVAGSMGNAPRSRWIPLSASV